MPRKNPLPQKEIEICRRVKDYRKSTKLSRVAFAHQAGIDSSELTRIEYLRSPLRYSTARKMIQSFNIDQRYLYGVTSYNADTFPVPVEIENKIPERALFSEAYEKYLKPYIESWVHDIDKIVHMFLKEKTLPISVSLEVLNASQTPVITVYKVLHRMLEAVVMGSGLDDASTRIAAFSEIGEKIAQYWRPQSKS